VRVTGQESSTKILETQRETQIDSREEKETTRERNFLSLSVPQVQSSVKNFHYIFLSRRYSCPNKKKAATIPSKKTNDNS
jgi:hypothetical protein